MFDPKYVECVMQHASHATTTQPRVRLDDVVPEDIMKYNPFQRLLYNKPTPASFYEALSILQAFNQVLCSRYINSDAAVVLDLDDTDGFLMAVQGRIVNSLCYSLHVKDIYRMGNDLNLGSIDRIASTPMTLASRCRFYNQGGIDLAFSQQALDFPTSVERILSCITAVSRDGLLAFRVDDYTSNFCQVMFGVLESWFSKVTLYKPSTMSCVKTEIYLVAINKHGQSKPGDSKLSEQIEVLEQERKRALNTILTSSGDNDQYCNLNSLNNWYLGKIF
jgi:hypothetical protein